MAIKKKKVTWRQIGTSLGKSYGVMIYENVNNIQMVKYIHVHRERGRWMIIRVIFYKDGIETKELNFSKINTLIDEVQRN